MQWAPLKVRCGWGRPAEECREVSQGPLCWIWVPCGLEPEQRASCELCVGNSGGENPNAQPGNVPSKYMEQNPYRENKYCTHTHIWMLNCLFLFNCVTSSVKSMYVKVHVHTRDFKACSIGCWFDFSFVLNSFMLGFWKYSTVNIRHETATKRACVGVYVDLSVRVRSEGLRDFWSEILNAADFYARTINQLFTIHTSGNHSVSLICSLSHSLSASFFSLTQYLSSLFCLFLCVWPSSTDHTPVRHIYSRLFWGLPWCWSFWFSVCGLMEVLEMVRKIFPLD